VDAVRNYGRRSGEIWHSMQKSMPDDLGSKRFSVYCRGHPACFFACCARFHRCDGRSCAPHPRSLTVVNRVGDCDPAAQRCHLHSAAPESHQIPTDDGDRSLTLRYVPQSRTPLDKSRREVLKHVHRLWGFIQQLNAAIFILLLQNHIKSPQTMDMLQHFAPAFISLTLRYVPQSRTPLDKSRREVLKHVHRLWGFDVMPDDLGSKR
jgi:spore cortex formation protein SpoVR/YcgB (stage V sporulation)